MFLCFFKTPPQKRLGTVRFLRRDEACFVQIGVVKTTFCERREHVEHVALHVQHVSWLSWDGLLTEVQLIFDDEQKANVQWKMDPNVPKKRLQSLEDVFFHDFGYGHSYNFLSRLLN